MNLKHLAFAVGALSVASIAVHFLSRPAPKPGADPRLGQPLVTSAAIDAAAGFRLQQGGQAVEVRKRSDGTWSVPSFHGLDADFTRLSQLTEALTTAKWKSFVSQSPEVLQRLELTTLSIALLDAQGQPSWTLQVGKNFDGGGRFARLADEGRAFVTDLSLWVDADAKNWADARLLTFSADEIKSIVARFPSGETLNMERAKAGADFTAVGLADGERLRPSQVTSVLSGLTGLRFSALVEKTDPRVTAATGTIRAYTLTTFAGKTFTVELRQAPPPPTPTPSPDAKALPPPRPPENPIFVELSSPQLAAPLQTVQATHRFEVPSYLLTSLPAERSLWVESTPATATVAPPPTPAP